MIVGYGMMPVKGLRRDLGHHLFLPGRSRWRLVRRQLDDMTVASNCDLAESVYLWYTRAKTMPDGAPDLAAGWVGENR